MYCDGLMLDFTVAGNAQPFGEGWSLAEPIGTWAVDMRSVIALPLSAHAGRYALEISLVPMLWPPAVPKQRFTLKVNGSVTLEGCLQTEGFTSISCDVPPGVMKTDGINVIEILHGDAASPSTLGESRDQRLLSLRFVNLTVHSRDAAQQERSLQRSRPLFLITGLALPGDLPEHGLGKFLSWRRLRPTVLDRLQGPQRLSGLEDDHRPRSTWGAGSHRPTGSMGGPTIVSSILEGIAYAVAEMPRWTRLVVCSNRDVPLLSRTDLLSKIYSLKA